MKIHPVGAELLHADGQTEMTKLVFAFRNFVNVPKNGDMFQPCFSITVRSYNTYVTVLVTRYVAVSIQTVVLTLKELVISHIHCCSVSSTCFLTRSGTV